MKAWKIAEETHLRYELDAWNRAQQEKNSASPRGAVVSRHESIADFHRTLALAISHPMYRNGKFRFTQQ